MGNRTPKEAKPTWQNVDLKALETRLKSLEKRDDKTRGNIQKRLKRLESNADANADGIVTRTEMENYMATQLKMREDELLRLRAELKRVQKAYSALSKQHDDVLQKVHDGRPTEIVTAAVNPAAINAFVDEMLDDPNINIYGLPDRFERAMYRKLFKMALAGLDKTFQNLSVDIMGHSIRMNIQPSLEKKDA